MDGRKQHLYLFADVELMAQVGHVIRQIRQGGGEGVMTATEILPWHRRQAIRIAAALPENTADALVVLRLASELVEGFLADSDKHEPAKVLTIVRDQA
jgi:hypothetical protein